VPLCPASSDVNLLRNGKGIIDLDAEVSDSALDLGVISLRQRIRSQGEPGQDGDPRVLVLIKRSGSQGPISHSRFPGRRSTVRPSHFPPERSHTTKVESRCGAVALGRTYLFPPLSSAGASIVQPWLRFHTPLIEPDMQISRIRLSDKTSRLCFRVQRRLQFLNPLRS